MRVKVGNRWFDIEIGQPLMIELTDQDKKNIAAMLPECKFYACFDDVDAKNMGEDGMRNWMEKE